MRARQREGRQCLGDSFIPTCTTRLGQHDQHFQPQLPGPEPMPSRSHGPPRLRFLGENILRHCQHARQLTAAPGAGMLAHTPGALHACAHALVCVLICHSLVLTYARARTHMQLPRHVPCLSVSQSPARHTPTLRFTHLLVFFLLHTQALLAPSRHHPHPHTPVRYTCFQRWTDSLALSFPL